MAETSVRSHPAEKSLELADVRTIPFAPALSRRTARSRPTRSGENVGRRTVERDDGGSVALLHPNEAHALFRRPRLETEPVYMIVFRQLRGRSPRRRCPVEQARALPRVSRGPPRPPRRPDFRSPDEDRGQLSGVGTSTIPRTNHLPAGVALDGDIDQPNPSSSGIRHFARQHDRAGAGPEHRPPARREPRDRLLPGRQFEELPEGRGLPSRDDEPRRLFDLFGPPRLEGLDPHLAELPPMGLEVPLERQHRDA
jgi:hypothetical protein